MVKRRFAHWMCRILGHKWSGMKEFEHMCTMEWCWRCWDTRVVHLSGPWPHTCKED